MVTTEIIKYSLVILLIIVLALPLYLFSKPSNNESPDEKIYKKEYEKRKKHDG
jgi:hypothetical protein